MMRSKRIVLFIILLLSTSCSTGSEWPSKTKYRYANINGDNIFYREAGSPERPTILLLHGFPSSSHAYRELIPLLSGQYHLIAPDNLGSGYSDHPDPKTTKYTFDLLSEKIIGLLEHKKISSFYIYMQDFGAPVGYRVALKHPEKIQGLIIQNANAYLDGLSPQKIEFFLTAGDGDSKFPKTKLYGHVSKDAIINKQYLRDISKDEKDIMSPDSWTHDLSFLNNRKDKEIQIELFKDYRTNLNSYPHWQEYLRKQQPPVLIVWGKKDPVFMASGAKAYLRDVPNAELHLLEAGHFALEEKPIEIAKLIVRFLVKNSHFSLFQFYVNRFF